jgi:hypothetical protein
MVKIENLTINNSLIKSTSINEFNKIIINNSEIKQIRAINRNNK